ncbi:hypothetical protein SKAU_G00237550 [Synaphobranchus kaupii]|uniref:Uncharacterized protein n=1 Tax=Synaphobranchus kaupii TaxID=118154 RepID=A0A9Q1F6X5_SYNKA|nr:hypothetical protein SKAU_G00237550 [Synaphobranchus kaupii]
MPTPKTGTTKKKTERVTAHKHSVHLRLAVMMLSRRKRSLQLQHIDLEYFKMRRNRHSRQDWVDMKWQPGTIPHSCQNDGSSCGVFVMQMGQVNFDDSDGAIGFVNTGNHWKFVVSNISTEHDLFTL